MKKDDLDICVGGNLKALRLLAGYTQVEMGKVLGVTFQQIQKYENGSNRLPVTSLYTLKSYFDVPYDYFFTGYDGDAPLESKLMMADKISVAVFRKVYEITDRKLKKKILNVVEALAA